MANKKIKFSKITKSSIGLNFKVRFKFEGTKGGYFVVTNTSRKIMGAKQFNSPEKALEYATELHNKTLR
jgi:hypothetical protein|tara:strand:+ start:19945 stop:20151 length:207 start_codon:yes stop_codon:yes gene_type:complete